MSTGHIDLSNIDTYVMYLQILIYGDAGYQQFNRPFWYIILSAQSAEDWNTYMKNTWTHLTDWFAANGLKINCNKSFYITFRSHTITSSWFRIRYPNLCKMSNVQFLGVDLDRYLRWHDLIAKINGQLVRACYAMRSLMFIDALYLKRTVIYLLTT